MLSAAGAGGLAAEAARAGPRARAGRGPRPRAGRRRAAAMLSAAAGAAAPARARAAGLSRRSQRSRTVLAGDATERLPAVSTPCTRNVTRWCAGSPTIDTRARDGRAATIQRVPTSRCTT